GRDELRTGAVRYHSHVAHGKGKAFFPGGRAHRPGAARGGGAEGRKSAACGRRRGEAEGEPRRAPRAAHGRGTRRNRAQEEEDAPLRIDRFGRHPRGLRALAATRVFASPLIRLAARGGSHDGMNLGVYLFTAATFPEPLNTQGGGMNDRAGVTRET